jgi:rhodanese-related sulfurtransferase
MTQQRTAAEVHEALVLRRELALIDLRSEAEFASGHPLFAAQLGADRIALEAPCRLPRRAVPLVLYDDGQGLVDAAARSFAELGYSDVAALRGGLSGWRELGYELFQDVNSYSKAFGELVEARRHTPSLSAAEVQALLESNADVAVLDARRFDEYAVMNIPTSTSVPGAELVLRARSIAKHPNTTIVVNCAGRTRSIIGAQSLIHAGLPNRVVALRNGTIGWSLAGQALEHGANRSPPSLDSDSVADAQRRARLVAYRAGVKRIGWRELEALQADHTRTLYRFDVRTPEEYAAGHVPGFDPAPGGQLVQEIDVFAPVRGARIVLADDLAVRADMTASWLAQMAWEVYVLTGLPGSLETGTPPIAAGKTTGRYRRPYEGTDHPAAAMQAYLDWELGLVDQLARDGTHGFFVI